ncbi:DUF2079 domain-containing protein [Streptomyces xanthophaeus]|uniref:DUF2079 domain-containing protein n=1 Tax=Streptomyces xanthophaeus TaxID=67385 RepID=UPI00386B0DFD|nr:DUF2079 domain-containing protein [Streptomyces xanthophaeus]WST65161.1 DUF2079 domain-containing protein [Streptomyces xanthophaeus]
MGAPAAAVIGACYGLSWGIASAVGFDFHEWAFAVPLPACSLAALGSGRMRAAACWALPPVLVKEGLGFTVAMTGLVIAWRGGRAHLRLGIATAVAGLAASAVELLAVLPSFHPGGLDGYLSSHGAREDAAGADGSGGGGVLHLLQDGTLGLITPQEKVPPAGAPHSRTKIPRVARRWQLPPSKYLRPPGGRTSGSCRARRRSAPRR